MNYLIVIFVSDKQYAPMSQTLSPISEERFRTLLKSHGLKVTPQRLAVHNAMLSLVHASAEAVSDFIASTGEKRIAVSTVYNILNHMASLGIYHRRLSADTTLYFDAVPINHIHLYNYVSNEFRDIQDPDLLASIEETIKRHRYRGLKVERVEVNVICHPSRRKKQKQI